LQILVTGVAGFIGMHVAKRLLLDGNQVVGVDNINNYYDINLKKSRLSQLISKEFDFHFFEIDIVNEKKISQIFKDNKFDLVIHLAAQAGVRFSIENPNSYLENNIKGFLNILESMKYLDNKNLIYASSSSVYGHSNNEDFKENQDTSSPISFYGVTKKTNELMAYTYSKLYKLNVIGLRFFTVYGPWGRPDMAMFKFTQSIISEQPIKIFNKGNMIRDFTYIDDVVESISRISIKITKENSLAESYKVFNIGSGNPISLMEYISILENNLNQKAQKEFLPAQLGDVLRTSADSSNLYKWIDFKPVIKVNHGVQKYVEWYKSYYG